MAPCSGPSSRPSRRLLHLRSEELTQPYAEHSLPSRPDSPAPPCLPLGFPESPECARSSVLSYRRFVLLIRAPQIPPPLQSRNRLQLIRLRHTHARLTRNRISSTRR